MSRPSRPARLWSPALALALLLSGLLVATAPAPVAHAAPTQVTEGSVTWGIKQSWRSYVGPCNETTGAAPARAAA
ncbi:HtaA domain-containing protein [Nocardioides humi]|uniref:HtaA domain-containing protein n=1 Tax=Nocardioides humi TaxID=449461 RepID=UPI0015E84A3A|nr:HtaA domain-containing protein [Nocardioides humi]